MRLRFATGFAEAMRRSMPALMASLLLLDVKFSGTEIVMRFFILKSS